MNVDWSVFNEILDVVWKLAIVLGLAGAALFRDWAGRHFSAKKMADSNQLRITALEQEDLRIRHEQALIKKRLDDCEARDNAIERMDRRLYRVAVLLSHKYPEEAKNIKLLEDL